MWVSSTVHLWHVTLKHSREPALTIICLSDVQNARLPPDSSRFFFLTCRHLSSRKSHWKDTHITPYFVGHVLCSCLIFSLACKQGQGLNSEDLKVKFWALLDWNVNVSMYYECYKLYVTPSLVFTIQSVRTTPSNEAVTIDFKAVTLKAGESRYTKVASISFDGQ